MAKIIVKVQNGDIFAIPLFVSKKNALHRFKKSDFEGPNRHFAFMRVVTPLHAGGILVEILDIEGTLTTPLSDIIQAPRLFRPVAVTGLAIHKKRWPWVGRQPGYDKERTSGFSSIELVEGTYEEPVLWRGGKKKPITPKEAIWWNPAALEDRIIVALKSKRKG